MVRMQKWHQTRLLIKIITTLPQQKKHYHFWDVRGISRPNRKQKSRFWKTVLGRSTRIQCSIQPRRFSSFRRMMISFMEGDVWYSAWLSCETMKPFMPSHRDCKWSNWTRKQRKRQRRLLSLTRQRLLQNQKINSLGYDRFRSRLQ